LAWFLRIEEFLAPNVTKTWELSPFVSNDLKGGLRAAGRRHKQQEMANGFGRPANVLGFSKFGDVGKAVRKSRQFSHCRPESSGNGRWVTTVVPAHAFRGPRNPAKKKKKCAAIQQFAAQGFTSM